MPFIKAMNKAFLLDRDGTINVDTGYVGDPRKLELLPGAAEAIRLMNDAGYLVIVISNQSGVARGYFGVGDVEAVNHRLNELLKERGAHIDAFYYCPHLADGTVPKYAIACNCRKPLPAMFEQAIHDYDLDIRQCYACGDKPRDVSAPEKLGMHPNRLGIVDAKEGQGHYENLLAFTEAVLKRQNI